MLRRLSAVAACAALGCSPPPPTDSAGAARAVAAWHAGRGEPALVRVEASPVEGAPGLWAAIVDTERQWWGSFGCYRIRNGRVAWQASPDESPGEQSVHSVRGRESAVAGGPLVEVVGRTHMGNGFLHLYVLRGRALRRVLHTRAYDHNTHDPFTFAGGVLEVAVDEDPSTGRLEVRLHGVLEERPGEDFDVPPSRSWPCSKTFVWDAVRERFVQDRGRRAGFDRYPEDEAWAY